MANSVCFTPLASFNRLNKPGVICGNCGGKKVEWISDVTHTSKIATFQALEIKATNSDQSAKRNTIVCQDCEGTGAKVCSQCKGSGVNAVDHFNGQFKAGGLCWLCRGRKEILCGSCNGAGFLGGIICSFED